jgi:dienelactone hydrolase
VTPSRCSASARSARLPCIRHAAVALVTVGLWQPAQAEPAPHHRYASSEVATDSLPAEVLAATDGPDPKFWFQPNAASVIYTRSPHVTETWRQFGLRPVQSLWVANAPAWLPRQIIPASSNRIFAYRGMWSPDGAHFAIAEIRGQEVHLVVIDPVRHVVVWKSPCILPRMWDRRDVRSRFAFAWAGDDHIVALRGPGRCRPSDADFAGEARQVPDVLAAWQAAASGIAGGVSVAESGVPFDRDKFPQVEALSFDIHRDVATRIARGPIEEFAVGPNAEVIAIRERVGWTAPDPGVPLVLGSRARYAIRIVSLTHPDTGLTLPARANILPGVMRWSPSGSAIAVIEADWLADSTGRSCVVAYAWQDRRETARLCGMIGDRPWRAHEVSDFVEWNTPMGRGVGWSAQNQLIVRMASPSDTVVSGEMHERFDWYLVSDSGKSDLTSHLVAVPDSFFVAHGETLALVNGQLLRLTALVTGHPTLTRAAPWLMTVSHVESVYYESNGPVVLVAREGADEDSVRFVYAHLGDSATLHTRPRPGESLIALAPARPVAVVSHVAGHHSTIYGVITARGVERTLFVATAAARDLDTVVVTVDEIPFRSPDGTTRLARLTLPPGYVAGRAYPTIVWGYPSPGDTLSRPAGAPTPPAHRITLAGTSALDFDALSRYGFVVLHVPVSYVSSDAAEGRLFDSFAAQFDAAVDEAVHLGVADSTRLGIIGHSFGGYTVMGVITRTHRYRAAVALAGMANLFLWHDSSPFVEGYGPQDPDALLLRATVTEAGQTAMGQTPWNSPAAYVANSPYFAADHITTPLLIAQGDLDVVPVDQGEMMFTALLRLGKRATFVHYAGVGHVVDGPYNGPDLEHRIHAWFAELLKARAASATMSY